MIFNDNQIKAIRKENGNVAVIATAGSGKTAVITGRIKRLVMKCGVAPDNILAVTFSKKAKENIQNRLSEECQGTNVETFHSIALKIVQDYYNGSYELWLKPWEKEKCLFDICKDMGLCETKEDMPYNDLLRFISTQKTNMTKPDNLIYDSTQPYKSGDMKYIYIAYESYKANHNYVEFDDLLNVVCDIFAESSDMLKKYQDKFQYILADEFQDISLNQALFLKYLSQSSNNLFVVGDGCQAIYQFRGGISKYLLNFDTEWVDADIVNLNINYRCSKNIVKTANELAKYLPESHSKYYVKAKADRSEISKPVFIECETADNEVQTIVNEIKGLIKDGYNYKDIAILARTNAQLQYFESGFAISKIPYVMLNDTSFIDKPEIKLVASYISLAHNSKDDAAFTYLYNKPNRWLDKKFFNEVSTLAKSKQCSLYDAMFEISKRHWRFQRGIDEIYNMAIKLQDKRIPNIGEEIRLIRKELNIDDYVTRGKLGEDGRCTEQIENLDAFESICNQFKTYDEFRTYLSNIKNYSAQADDNKVELMTIHKSKGLEFPVVFVVGCSEGLLPHSRATDIDDEKRLMYVAITRAMDKLYLTSNLFYNSHSLTNSSFIDLLGDTIQRKCKGDLL